MSESYEAEARARTLPLWPTDGCECGTPETCAAHLTIAKELTRAHEAGKRVGRQEGLEEALGAVRDEAREEAADTQYETYWTHALQAVSMRIRALLIHPKSERGT